MSLENISDKKLEESIKYIIDNITHIVNKCGDRYPGSKGENNAHEYLKEELSKYVDEVQMEPFKVAPKAFMAFMPIAGLLLILSIILYWFLPFVSLLLDLIAIFIVIIQFFLYKPLLDPFFPKKTSYNLLGVRKPEQDVKRTIIFSGHVDASYEWRYSKINPILLRFVLVPAILGLLIKVAMDLFNTLLNDWSGGYQGVWLVLGIVQLIMLPIAITIIFFVNYSVVSPGASDNLSGTVMALAIAKFLDDEKIALKNTEVDILLTGSEEAGIRGAKAYCKKHKKELLDKGAIFIGLESFCEMEYMAINNKDMNGLVKNDPAVCLLLKNAAQACGYDLQYQAVYIGATDAAAFSQAGIPASTIEAMDPGPPKWYHTRYDNIENLRPETLKVGFQISLETLKIFDKEGLPS